MGLAQAELTPLKLSTSDLPERDRLPLWREGIGTPRDNEALRLLVKYTSILRGEPNQMTAELLHLVVTHIHDLMALALRATPDGTAMANARGVRAARLKAIKAEVFENLARPDLTVGEIARSQGVTPRYVQMLFESEGVTFSEFVCEARLGRAHDMLSDPGFCDRSIMTIAFAAGFGDLSYFNRCFRRRFGAAPSEIRREICPTRKSKREAHTGAARPGSPSFAVCEEA